MNEKSSPPIARKRLAIAPVLLALVVYHFFLALYLSFVKQVRKSLLFPGG